MDSMAQAFVSERVVTPEGVRAAAILEDGGKILGIVGTGEIPAGHTVQNFGRLAILPGLVDSHVHISEPGRTEWEGFWTATRAAAAGGYTTLVDMPLNCLPETTTVSALEAKRTAAGAGGPGSQSQCFVDWAAWGGVAGENAADIEPLAAAGVKGFKCFLIYPGCEGFQMVSLAQLEAALPHVARTGLPLLVHAELEGPIQAVAPSLASADWRRYETYLRSRPDEAELAAIRILLRLCHEYGFHLHIVHLATALALDELRQTRADGLHVTVETCPHYLHFAAEEVPDGSTLHKCAPPLRSRDNREGLWDGIRDGIIDLVATDHSPCPPVMKRLDEGRFDLAWGGIASLAVALPVMWTGLHARGFGLRDIARLMAEKPAQLAQLSGRKGRLAPGYDADLVIFDPEAIIEVTSEGLHTRYAVSPYVGERLRGKILSTWLRGVPVFKDGKFTETPSGVEV
jgi:allantoinase